jgi:hypothetical protein
MSNKTYDRIKLFLSVWLMPLIVIIGGVGTFLEVNGITGATTFTGALVVFLGVLGQAFQVQTKKAANTFYNGELDETVEGIKGYAESREVQNG